MSEVQALRRLKRGLKTKFSLNLPALAECRDKHVAQVMADDMYIKVFDELLEAVGP